ncbi:MAG TPA: tRNA lysidine(34) synthetase TilS [Vicinamibacterales bacterium]
MPCASSLEPCALTGLHQQVRRTIRRHNLCPPGSRLLVGISGGSDSVALALLLLDLAANKEFSVASLAHVNHQLRPSADRDEAFCRDLAVRLGLPIAVERFDVKAYGTSHGLSIEDAARRVRYDFLGRAAAQAEATCVAVGHTQDDQAETFLLKLIRGAGLTGLGGIYPRRGLIVRPLLDVSRAELRAYLAGRGEPWMEDESNEDVENPRNRVRHVVLPELDRTARGETRPAIARAAALVREDGEWLDELSRERFAAVASLTPEGVEIDAARLAAEAPPVVRRVLLEAMRGTAGGREIGLDHVEAVRAILCGNDRGIDLPGSRVELRRGKLVLMRQKGASK